MTPIDTQAIQARLDQASRGPWRPSDDEPTDVVIWGDPCASEPWIANIARGNVDAIGRPFIISAGAVGSDECDTQTAHNAAFIAAARQDVPALLTAVRERDELLAKLQGVLQGLGRWAYEAENGWAIDGDIKEALAWFKAKEPIGAYETEG